MSTQSHLLRPKRWLQSYCPELSSLFQFELKPMFLVESRKMAIACAPYTHMNLEPVPVEDEVPPYSCITDDAISQ